MNSTSAIISKLHSMVRSLEEMRAEISTELMALETAGSARTPEQAQLADLHQRISKALKELAAEARQM